jgi:hypothetical protein
MLDKEIYNVLEPYSEHFLGVKGAGSDFKLEIGQSVIINTLTVEAQALNPSISGHWFAISLYEEKHYESSKFLTLWEEINQYLNKPYKV